MPRIAHGYLQQCREFAALQVIVTLPPITNFAAKKPAFLNSKDSNKQCSQCVYLLISQWSCCRQRPPIQLCTMELSLSHLARPFSLSMSHQHFFASLMTTRLPQLIAFDLESVCHFNSRIPTIYAHTIKQKLHTMGFMDR